jgi:hypothetical protein
VVRYADDLVVGFEQGVDTDSVAFDVPGDHPAVVQLVSCVLTSADITSPGDLRAQLSH